MSTAFTVPISTGGAFTCQPYAANSTSPSTSPQPSPDPVYILSFTSPPDNRVTIPFIDGLIRSLRILEHGTRGRKGGSGGVLVLTSGIAKFFSNGFDLHHVRENAEGNRFFARFLDGLRELLV